MNFDDPNSKSPFCGLQSLTLALAILAFPTRRIPPYLYPPFTMTSDVKDDSEYVVIKPFVIMIEDLEKKILDLSRELKLCMNELDYAVRQMNHGQKIVNQIRKNKKQRNMIAPHIYEVRCLSYRVIILSSSVHCIRSRMSLMAKSLRELREL